MKLRPIGYFLLLSGIVFGLAALAMLTAAFHLHPPSRNILRAPELELIIKDDLILRQKLRDEEDIVQARVLTMVGAHFKVCILLAASGGCQVVAGLTLMARCRRLPQLASTI